ncbi:MAG: hypothetical protein D3917_11685, partial [Candidatus Electrothrix sp. AX5]|nr:hypothetical protein [Candidatus Electrothrix sp. AX5]
MNIKKIISVILLFVLTSCSNVPKEDIPKKNTAQQKTTQTTVALDTKTDNADSDDILDAIPQEGKRVKKEKIAGSIDAKEEVVMMAEAPARAMFVASTAVTPPQPEWNTESYNARQENGFISTSNDPLSTFSIDVDTASYSNVRRFINEGSLPPKGAVRIEELINYFSYDYPQPDSEHPFSVTTEVGPCPWNDSRKLVRIGLKAKDIDKKDLPPSNLVFLIDVSGSMSEQNKL